MSTPTPRRRKLLTLKTKINIIKNYENGEKVLQISKNLNLPTTTVRTIIKDKKRIIAASKTTSTLHSTTIIRNRHGIIAQMEGTLKKWCDEQAEQNINLTRNVICTKARSLFDALKKDYGEVAKNETFLASNGWYIRFKRRCQDNSTDILEQENQEAEVPDVQVKMETTKDSSEINSVEVNTSSAFSNYLETIVADGEYTAHTVFNVDEIGLYWKKMPTSSYHKENGFNESKDRLTILLGGNAAGDLKLKPLLVYRLENPKALQNKSKGGLPVIWKSNSRACMTASLFEDWIGHYFIPEVERYCYVNNIPCKVLLVIDSALYHLPTTLIDFDHRIKVIFLPSGEATSLQPINQDISLIFKGTYTHRLFLHLIEASRQNEIISFEDSWKEYNILDGIRIIVDSWADIKDTDWQKSWQKLCPFLFHTRNPIENDRISAIVEEIVNLTLQLDMKVSKQDVDELLDSHNKELTIEDLIEMQEQSSYEELDVHDPLQQETTMTAENLMQALTHIKTGLQILQNIDINEQRATSTKVGVMKLLNVYEELLTEKTQLNISFQDEQ